MRRVTVLSLALLALAATSARGQYATPQGGARDLGPPVYYQPAPQAVPEYPAPRATALVEVPLELGRPPRQKKGCWVVQLALPSLRLARGPAIDLAVTRTVATPARAVYLEPAAPPPSRDLQAPPKAVTPRAAPQAPPKDPGGFEAAEAEPAWARRLAERMDEIDDRLDELQAGERGLSQTDRAPAPPRPPTKDE